jgi:lysophospholipase L1-like esterase
VVWYGDSIIEYWQDKAEDVWEDYMEDGDWKGSWAGIAGDTTRNLLFRIQNGEFPDNIYPKVVIISIGINDLMYAGSKDLEDEDDLNKIVGNAKENVQDMISFIRSKACEVQFVISSVLTAGDDKDENDWPSK